MFEFHTGKFQKYCNKQKMYPAQYKQNFEKSNDGGWDCIMHCGSFCVSN
jgi:hypothetical protein